jgi:ATP-dependent DNA ligase
VFYAFDLLWRDGDLRKLPQIERKRMLSDLLGENDIGLPDLRFALSCGFIDLQHGTEPRPSY